MIYQYFCPLIWALYSVYLNPQLVFKLIQWENTPRKSVKEQSFLSKHNFMLVFNFILAPWIASVVVNLVSASSVSVPTEASSQDDSLSQPSPLSVAVEAL